MLPPRRAAATLWIVAAHEVVLETSRRRTFASVVDWPGWCRSGKTEDDALEAVVGYLERYRSAIAPTGLTVPARGLQVVERTPGNATTEFGAPGVVAELDSRPLTKAQASRQATILAACWATLERVAAGAPAELRKGPRGGGRDRDKILDHVAAAEFGYARKIGVRHKAPGDGDGRAWAALRADIHDTVARSRGGPGEGSQWPMRYAVRRVAWHVLDHAWEIEDRSD